MNSSVDDQVKQPSNIKAAKQWPTHSKEEPMEYEENANNRVESTDMDLFLQRSELSSKEDIKENNPNGEGIYLQKEDKAEALCKQASLKHEENAATSNQSENRIVLIPKSIEQLRSGRIEKNHSCLEQMCSEADQVDNKNVELNFHMEEDTDIAEGPFVTNSIAQSLTYKNNDGDDNSNKQLIDSDNISQEIKDLTSVYAGDMTDGQLPTKIEIKDENLLDEEKPCSTQSFCHDESVKQLHMFKYKSNEKELKAPKAKILSDGLDLVPILPTSLPPAVVGGFENWTTINLPKEVEVLLSFGPKLCKQNNIFLTKRFPTYYIDNCLSVRVMNPDNYLQQMLSIYYAKIAAIQKIKNDYNRRVFLHMISVTQNFLAKYQDVRIVTTAYDDKCTILVYKEQYRIKMQQLLDAGIKTGVYRLYEGDFCTQYKLVRSSFDSISSLLLKHCNNTKPAPFTNSILIPLKAHATNCGESVLPCLDGTVALYEQGCPCRPVFNTTRWLANPIKEVVALVLNEIFINPSYTGHADYMNLIAKQLHGIPNCVGYEYVTYKIKDLFSIIQTQYIYSYLERFAKSNLFQPKCQISPELFLECLKFSLDNCNYFSYECHVYAQLSGLPQGAPDTDKLIKIYLDYLIESHASILFGKHFIVYWWMYKHEFLVYMLPSEIESFKQDFKMCTHLELKAEREIMYPSRHMPTIAFFDLQITRGPTKSLFNQRRPSVYLCHFDSLGGAQYPKKEMFENIQRVLKWTSTTFLLDDLKKQEIELRNNGFTIYQVANAYNKTIRVEIEKLAKGESEIKQSKQEIAMRTRILLQFKDRFEIHEQNLKKELKRLKK